jgi:hypothetical protein
MGKRKGFSSLFVILLLGSLIGLAGCANIDNSEEAGQMEDQPTELTAAAGHVQCEAYEEEVESGICSYIVDCDDADSCEVWSNGMVKDLDERFGELVYAEEWDVDEKESEKEPDELAAYAVEGDFIDLTPANEDEEYYAWLWNRFVWIIPSEQRQMISQFQVYDHADTMAYVIQDEEDYESWIYAANQIQATYETERIMTDVHEFGHLLSLNAEQLDYEISENNCHTYMLDEGCASEDSYIYSFYRQFWEKGGSEDENDYVTEYAMSNLYEDFADSWAYFVMTPRPAGHSTADAKVTFFYDYEELVMLKAQILGRAASYLDRNVEYE